MSAARTSDAPTLVQSAIVELVLGAAGLAIILATGRSLADAMTAPVAVPIALAVGVSIGAATGAAFGLSMSRPSIAPRVAPFLARFTSSNPTPWAIAMLALAAALGEETLFRAAIQPMAGIVVASLLFTLAHALIADFRHPTPGKVAYAALAFGMGLLLGVLYDRLGIAASMGAHAAFDAAALLCVRPLILAARTLPA